MRKRKIILRMNIICIFVVVYSCMQYLTIDALYRFLELYLCMYITVQ